MPIFLEFLSAFLLITVGYFVISNSRRTKREMLQKQEEEQQVLQNKFNGNTTLIFTKEILNLILMYALQPSEMHRISDIKYIYGKDWNCFAALKLEHAKFVSKPNNETNNRTHKYRKRGFVIDKFGNGDGNGSENNNRLN